MVEGSGVPTGRRFRFAHGPGVGNAGLLSVVPTGPVSDRVAACMYMTENTNFVCGEFCGEDQASLRDGFRFPIRTRR